MPGKRTLALAAIGIALLVPIIQVVAQESLPAPPGPTGLEPAQGNSQESDRRSEGEPQEEERRSPFEDKIETDRDAFTPRRRPHR
jgi:hypothetical protein